MSYCFFSSSQKARTGNTCFYSTCAKSMSYCFVLDDFDEFYNLLFSRIPQEMVCFHGAYLIQERNVSSSESDMKSFRELLKLRSVLSGSCAQFQDSID